MLFSYVVFWASRLVFFGYGPSYVSFLGSLKTSSCLSCQASRVKVLASFERNRSFIRRGHANIDP